MKDRSPNARPVEILLVEDNPGDAVLVREMLCSFTDPGYLLQTQDRLTSGLATLAHEHFDCILSDLGLPDSSGEGTVETLLRAAGTTPLVVLTGNGDEELGRRAIQAGAEDFILKGQLNGPLLHRIITYAIERNSLACALKESVSELAVIHSHSPIAMMLIDQDRHILKINPAATTLAQTESENLFDRCIGVALRCVESEDSPDGCGLTPVCRDCVLRKTIRQTFSDKKSRQGVPLSIYTKFSDSPLELVLSSAYLKTSNQPRVLVCIQDIQDLKRAEAERREALLQLNQAQKMETVGRLAGGIAHDFNNLLTTIIGCTNICLEELETNHPLQAVLREILSSANKSAGLTKQLLAFARRDITTPKIVNLNKSIENTLSILKRLIGENTRLIWTPSTSDTFVFIDPSQIDQILTNLAVNARDAIQGSGTIRIATERIDASDVLPAESLGSTRGPFVVLHFSDTGSGMPPETKEKIFEPFFTTKETGRGTGLGLSTVFGIVKQCNGFIQVESQVGEGTQFHVYLPACKTQTSLDLPAPNAPPRLEGDGKTILLVEDAPSIRKITRRMLEKMGFTVQSAENAAVALKLLTENPVKVDLLVSDVIMPGMNGDALFEALHAQQPDMRCLFISGYTADFISEKSVYNREIYLLQKPFNQQELKDKLAEVMAAPPPSPEHEKI